MDDKLTTEISPLQALPWVSERWLLPSHQGDVSADSDGGRVRSPRWGEAGLGDSVSCDHGSLKQGTLER